MSKQGTLEVFGLNYLKLQKEFRKIRHTANNILRTAESQAMTITRTLEFIQEIDKLKEVERKTLNYFSDRYERSAEHSWHLATAVLVFLPHAKDKAQINIEKAMQMALVHDIVEIDAGDTIIYDVNPNVHLEEQKAANRIFGLLPEAKAKELREIWDEFEAHESFEAKYVKALDRFLPLYSNCLHGGTSWKTHNISLEQVLEKNKNTIEQALPELWNIALEKILAIAEAGGLKKESRD